MDEDDIHFCLVCQKTIEGLLNYVEHRKSLCPGKKPTTNAGNKTDPVSSLSSHPVSQNDALPVQNHGHLNIPLPAAEFVSDSNNTNTSSVSKECTVAIEKNEVHVNVNVSRHNDEGNLLQDLSESTVAEQTEKLPLGTTGSKVSDQMKINHFHNSKKPKHLEENTLKDFFSSLALQSKTTSLTEVSIKDQQADSHLPISNFLANIQFSSDEEEFGFSEDELFREAFSEDSDSEHPPKNHTSGKWRPGQGPPKTGGKWKPGQAGYQAKKYSRGNSTGGKWKPGQKILQGIQVKRKRGRPPKSSTQKKPRRPQKQVYKEEDTEDEDELFSNKEDEVDDEDIRNSIYCCSYCNVKFTNRFRYSNHCSTKQHKELVRIGKCYEEKDSQDVLTLSVEDDVTSSSATEEALPISGDHNRVNPDATSTARVLEIQTSDVNKDNRGLREPLVSNFKALNEPSSAINSEHPSMNDSNVLNKPWNKGDQNRNLGSDSEVLGKTPNLQDSEKLGDYSSLVAVENAEVETEEAQITKTGDANIIQKQAANETGKDSNHSKLPLRCDICDKEFSSKYVLARHLLSPYHKTRSAGNPKIFAVLELYHKYIVRLSQFQCSLCRFYFNRQDDFLSHLQSDEHVERTLDLNGELHCTLCNFLCRNNSELLDHFQEDPFIAVHEAKGQEKKPCIIKERHFKAKCKYCEKPMHSRIHMKRHLKYCLKKRSGPGRPKKGAKHACPECGQLFKSYNSLGLHQFAKHNIEIENYCKLCHKTLIGKKSFEKHINGEKHQAKVARENLFLENSQAEVNKGESDPMTPEETENKNVNKAMTDSNNKLKFSLNLRMASAKCLEDKVYKCDHCDFTAQSYGDLRPHYMEVHSNHILVCEHCDLTFLNEKAMKHHKQSKQHQDQLRAAANSGKTKSTIMKCDFCPRRFTEDGWRQFHMEVYHLHPNSEEALRNAKGYQDLTWEMFKEFLSSIQHLERDDKLDCPECSKTLKKEHMLEHLRLHSGHKPFACRMCPLAFVSALSLRRHLLGHLGLMERKCEECGKEYKKAASYKEHMMQHKMEKMGNQKFMCDICGQSFYLQKQLNNHMRRHGERRYKCPMEKCRWSFYFSSELEAHIRSHTKERPFLCDVCGYSASTKNRLLRHTRIHTGERKFHCEYCTYKAGTSTHLRRHMRIHIGSKPYKCPYCDYTCNTHENIRKHIIKTKKHAGMAIYPCKFCKFGTNKVTEFREHLLTDHPVEFNSSTSDGLAEFTGLYNKDEDLRKPAEGNRINPIKERKHRSPPMNKPKEKKHSKTLDSFEIHAENLVNIPNFAAQLSNEIVWQQETEKSSQQVALMVQSLQGTSAANFPNATTTTVMIQNNGSYTMYQGFDRNRMPEQSFIQTPDADNVMRLASSRHSTVQPEGNNNVANVDYLELEVETS